MHRGRHNEFHATQHLRSFSHHAQIVLGNCSVAWNAQLREAGQPIRQTARARAHPPSDVLSDSPLEHFERGRLMLETSRTDTLALLPAHIFLLVPRSAF